MDLSQTGADPVLTLSLSLNAGLILALLGLLIKYLHDTRTGKGPGENGET